MKNVGNDNNVIQFVKSGKILAEIADEKAADGDFEGALSNYLEIERVYKFSGELFRNIANSFTQLGMYEMSITYWFKFLNYVSKRHYAEAYNGLGGNYYLLKNNELAAYYFNLQINDKGDKELPFDDYMYQLFFAAQENARPIKLVDAQGEIDSKNIEKAKRTFEKNPTEAYNLLSEIKSDSSQYGNALITMAAFNMVNEKIDLAVEQYKQALDYSEQREYALNNLLGCYAVLNDYEKADTVVQQLKSNDCKDFDQCAKFFHLFHALNDNAGAYTYALYLSAIFDNPDLYYYTACAAFNCEKYDEAEELFNKHYRITDFFVSLEHAKLCKNPKRFKKKRAEKISYMQELHPSYISQLEKSVARYMTMSAASFKRRASDLIELSRLCFGTSRLDLQGLSCQLVAILKNNRAEKYLKNLLIDPAVNDKVKILILSLLVDMENDKLTGLVYGGVYTRIQYEKVQFTEENGEVFYSAYAVAFGRIAPYDESVLYKLKISAYDIYYKLISNGTARKVSDVIALAAIIILRAGINVGGSIERLLDYVGSDMPAVEKIMKLIDED
ncbi:MAG: hypothetical protein IJW13_03105 [Clostridia bacterium]|nr:hypothetical protein [Clostridia bacterium]